MFTFLYFYMHIGRFIGHEYNLPFDFTLSLGQVSFHFVHLYLICMQHAHSSYFVFVYFFKIFNFTWMQALILWPSQVHWMWRLGWLTSRKEEEPEEEKNNDYLMLQTKTSFCNWFDIHVMNAKLMISNSYSVGSFVQRSHWSLVTLKCSRGEGWKTQWWWWSSPGEEWQAQ